MTAGSSSANTKYIALAVFFVAAIALMLFALTCDGDEEPLVEETPTEAPPERETALETTDLIIPEEGEDAGEPEVEDPPPTQMTKVRYVPRNCEGEISAAQARAGIDHRQVRACYERQLRENPQLAGTLSLQLQIDSNGRVARASAGGSLRDPAVRQCVQSRARTWSFPAPQGDNCAIISVPFSLTPRP